MKRTIFLMLNLLLITLLCACSGSDNTYTVEMRGREFVVDRENRTISDDWHTYEYTFSGNSSSYRVRITYPNGAEYWFDQTGAIGTGGWTDGYGENKYADGDTLCDVLLEKAPKEGAGEKILIGIFLLAVGVFNAVKPEVAWYLEYGWRFKDAEPSDSAIALNRLGGAVAIIAAVFLIVFR